MDELNPIKIILTGIVHAFNAPNNTFSVFSLVIFPRRPVRVVCADEKIFDHPRNESKFLLDAIAAFVV